MPNGIRIEVKLDQFKKITDINKKMDFMFEVLLNQQATDDAQQARCEKTIKKFEKQFEECEELINHSIPRRNRKIDVGVGAGTGLGIGALGYELVQKFIEFIKSYISGG